MRRPACTDAMWTSHVSYDRCLLLLLAVGPKRKAKAGTNPKLTLERRGPTASERRFRADHRQMRPCIERRRAVPSRAASAYTLCRKVLRLEGFAQQHRCEERRPSRAVRSPSRLPTQHPSHIRWREIHRPIRSDECVSRVRRAHLHSMR